MHRQNAAELTIRKRSRTSQCLPTVRNNVSAESDMWKKSTDVPLQRLLKTGCMLIPTTTVRRKVHLVPGTIVQRSRRFRVPDSPRRRPYRRGRSMHRRWSRCSWPERFGCRPGCLVGMLSSLYTSNAVFGSRDFCTPRGPTLIARSSGE